MAKTPLAVIILAAGKGKRMKSRLPKVLHKLAGKPMLCHILDMVTSIKPEHIVTVVSSETKEPIEAVIQERNIATEIVVQKEQSGTADAVKVALENLEAFTGNVLVLYGDTPLLTAHTMESLISELNKYAIAILGFEPQDPTGYGRLKTDGSSHVLSIIEHKDASFEELRISLCNSGVMAFSKPLADDLLPAINNQNAKGEYYLTDIVGLANDAGKPCGYCKVDASEVLGVNSRQQLAELEAIVQQQLRIKALEQGVSLIDPQTIYLSCDTEFGEDVTIHPYVVIGEGVSIASNVTIHSFSHIVEATIGQGTAIGPYARIRPGTELGAEVRVGNFVEVKNAIVADGAKMSHLSYIGDAQIGSNVNIGAGTITCNYDGVNKHKTIIDKDVFIGSNTALVAPVSIGQGALIGAGSVITDDVSADSLALSRSKQVELVGKGKKTK